MGHQIGWDNENKTVVLQAYADDASKEDLYHLVRKSAELLGTVKHTVHLIVDERKFNPILTQTDIAYIEKQMPENQGVVVVIVSSSHRKYKMAVLDLGQRMHLKTFSESYFADSLEHARQFLQEAFGVRYAS